jgi:hypothetical protein
MKGVLQEDRGSCAGEAGKRRQKATRMWGFGKLQAISSLKDALHTIG